MTISIQKVQFNLLWIVYIYLFGYGCSFNFLAIVKIIFLKSSRFLLNVNQSKLGNWDYFAFRQSDKKYIDSETR